MEMTKDMDEQLMTLADEKISYEQLKNGNVNTWLIKLDQHTRHLAAEIKQSKEAEAKAKKRK
jgi:hypothetical protein